MALDKEGNVVVIENKRDDSGNAVEWQAIKYASYCSTLLKDDIVSIYSDYLKNKGSQENAQEVIEDFLSDDEVSFPSEKVRIILVSRQFREEVTSAVQWLLNQGIDIECVTIKPYKDNDCIYLDSDVILPQAQTKDYTLKLAYKDKEVQKQKKNQNISNEKHAVFWQEFVDHFPNKSKSSFAGRDFSNCPLSHINGSARMGGPRTSYVLVANKKAIRIELYIDGNKGAALNKQIFDYLESHKNTIEDVLRNHKVKWQRLEDKGACRISINCDKSLSFENDEDKEEIFKYFNNNILTFESAFEPYANKIREMVNSYSE